MEKQSREREEILNLLQEDDGGVEVNLDDTVETKNQCEDEPLLDESVYELFEGIPPQLLDKLFCFDGKKRTTEEILEIAEMLGQDSQRERQEFENYLQLSRMERIIKPKVKAKKPRKTAKGFGK